MFKAKKAKAKKKAKAIKTPTADIDDFIPTEQQEMLYQQQSNIGYDENIEDYQQSQMSFDDPNFNYAQDEDDYLQEQEQQNFVESNIMQMENIRKLSIDDGSDFGDDATEWSDDDSTEFNLIETLKVLEDLNGKNALQLTQIQNKRDDIAFEISHKRNMILDGYEKLTDIALASILEHSNSALHVHKLSAIGCVHLTDACALLIAKYCRNLKIINLDGCKNLTSKALDVLISQCEKLNDVSMKNCNLKRLPHQLVQKLRAWEVKAKRQIQKKSRYPSKKSHVRSLSPLTEQTDDSDQPKLNLNGNPMAECHEDVFKADDALSIIRYLTRVEKSLTYHYRINVFGSEDSHKNFVISKLLNLKNVPNANEFTVHDWQLKDNKQRKIVTTVVNFGLEQHNHIFVTEGAINVIVINVDKPSFLKWIQLVETKYPSSCFIIVLTYARSSRTAEERMNIIKDKLQDQKDLFIQRLEALVNNSMSEGDQWDQETCKTFFQQQKISTVNHLLWYGMPQIHNYVMVDSNNGKGIEGVRQEIIQCINAIFQRKDCDLNINGVAKHLYWSRFRDEYSKFKYQAKKNHNNNKHIYFLNDLISDLREDVHKRIDKFLFACEMLHNSGELFMTKYNDQWYFIPDLTWLYERLTEIGQGIVPNVAIPEGDQIIINLAKNAGISAVMSNVINLTRSLTDLTCLPNSPAKPLTLLWEDYHPNEYFYEQTYEIISYSPASLSVLKQIQSNLIRLTQNVHHLWNDGLLFSLGYVECLLLLIESESTPTDDGLVSLKISARCNAIPDADAAEEIQSGLRQTFIMCCYIIEAAFEPLPGIATKTTLKSNVAKENDIEGQLNRPKFDEVDIPAICGHKLEKSASEIVCVQCQPYSSENNQQNINKYQKEKTSSCTNCGRCNYCIQFMSDVRKESATPAFVNDWSRAFNFQQIGNILKHPSDKEIVDERQVVVSDLNYSIAVNKYPLNFVTGRIFQFTILDIANVDFILGLVTSSYDKISRPGLTDSSYSIVFTESAFYANNQNMGSLAFDIDHLCPGDQLSIIGRYSADKKKEIVFSRNGLVLLVVNEPDNKDYYPIIHCVDTTADDSRIILQFEGNTIPITQGAKFVTWEKGMRLEAKDRLNPSLMCVATVDDVNDNELLIHFDGWTRKYDYTCKSTSTDIHPIGWCENNYHRRLEPPKGDNKSDFKWAQYLETIQAVAAPVELFTPEQLGEKDSAKISFYASTLQSCTKLQGDFGVSRVHRLMNEKTENSIKIFLDTITRDTACPFMLYFPKLDSFEDLNLLSWRFWRNNYKKYISLLCTGSGCFDAKEIDIHGFEETGHPIAGADCYSQWSQQSIVIIWLISHIVLDLIKLQNVYKISSKALRLFGLQEDKIEDDKFVKQAEVILNMITTMLDVPALKICQRLDRNSIMKAIPEIEKLTAEAIEKCATCNAVEIKDRYASNKIHYICPAHTLAIAGNDQNLEEFPSDTILSLNKLCNMKMYNNKIAEIPEQVFQQFSTTLTNINFSGNKLKELPLGMKCLKNIQQIFIGYNEITNIPEGLLSAFSDSLISLDLSSNFIRRLPDDIGTLTNLKMLNLAYNPIDQLSNNIGQLKSLEALNLTGHTLTYLPDTFSSLQNLSKLSLNGVPWIQVTSQDYLHNKIITKETIVDLLMHPSEHVKVNAYTKEQIESLFDECDTNANGILDTQEMINLNAKLYLSFPRLQGRKENEENEESFLKNLQNFTKLKELHLTHLALSTISEEAISNLNSLINLNLSDNPKLTSLPGVISMLPLKELSLRGTHSLKTPPPEIKNRGFQAIMGYLKRLLTGSVECKRTKLMMVGLGGAGKTSLVEALLSPYGQIYESEAEREITDGIDIDTWTVKTDEGRIEYSIWDFAGQTLYYNTHQFFLSDRAVYFLVWNTRLGHEHAGLDFWLSSIACHAPKAPVFVIGTHCDMVSVTELPEEVMKNRYQQIVGFHYVSSFVGTGIPKLKDCLIKETLQQKYMGEKIPQVWLNLEKAILEKGNTVKVLTWNEVTEIASSIGIFDNTELRQAIGFLHDLGSVQHFNNIALRDRVVIDPQWIVDAMACVVSVHETPIKEGKFKHSDMAKIWKQYDKQHHQWLLKLTEQFDLSYALPKQDVNLVPCLLPGTEPKFDWIEDIDNSNIKATKMKYIFEYLPAGLFNRVQVRLCKFTDNQVIWKTGSLLVKNENKAVMKQLRNTDNLLIEVRGISPNNLLFLIHEILESLIAEAFHGISYEYEVPCIDCLNQGSRDPSMFRSTRIRRASELKAAFLQCEHNFHSVSIHELQSVIPPESPNEFDLHLRNSMRTLSNLSASYELDAYISTLDSDTGVPARIYNDLCSKGYSCYRKQSESGSQDADFLAIKQSNIVIICMTDEYIKDEKCRLELSHITAFLRKPIALVIINNSWEWKTDSIGMLMADEVYIDMSDLDKYDIKFDELDNRIKLHDKRNRQVNYGDCFISYSWSNSELACKLGTVPLPGAIGRGDPRQLKEQIEGRGISCWIDVNNVGKTGLFEDIAAGLQQAKVMVACVSDEYVKSRNCLMEFRFALNSLKLPVILAVVGTGYQWLSTEVGMLSISLPKINLQDDASEDKVNQITKYIQEEIRISDKSKDTAEANTTEDTLEMKHLQFLELLELAQRNLLRQITNIADSILSTPKPRLLILDWKVEETTLSQEEQEGLKDPDLGFYVDNKVFFVKFLCEHEEGWHLPAGNFEYFSFGNITDVKEAAKAISGYIARVMSLIQHKELEIKSVAGIEGEAFIDFLVKLAESSDAGIMESYQELSEFLNEISWPVANSGLLRCQLPNGKVSWLCREHLQSTGATVMDDSSAYIIADPGLGSLPLEIHESSEIETRRDSNDDKRVYEEDDDISSVDKQENEEGSHSVDEAVNDSAKEITTVSPFENSNEKRDSEPLVTQEEYIKGQQNEVEKSTVAKEEDDDVSPAMDTAFGDDNQPSQENMRNREDTSPQTEKDEIDNSSPVEEKGENDHSSPIEKKDKINNSSPVEKKDGSDDSISTGKKKSLPENLPEELIQSTGKLNLNDAPTTPSPPLNPPAPSNPTRTRNVSRTCILL